MARTDVPSLIFNWMTSWLGRRDRDTTTHETSCQMGYLTPLARNSRPLQGFDARASLELSNYMLVLVMPPAPCADIVSVRKAIASTAVRSFPVNDADCCRARLYQPIRLL